MAHLEARSAPVRSFMDIPTPRATASSRNPSPCKARYKYKVSLCIFWTLPECGRVRLSKNTRSPRHAIDRPRFPYLLPNILGASLALSGLPMVFFFLKETAHFDSDNGSGGGR